MRRTPARSSSIPEERRDLAIFELTRTKSTRFKPRPFATILLVTLALCAAATGEVRAGCLSEWDKCGTCAAKRGRQALHNLDLAALASAWADAIDCDIDLVHCIVLGKHHRYRC